MDAIPEPDLLFAERLLATCPDASPSARRIVHDVCEYATALWNELHEMREYLLSSTEAGHARPAGPRDEEGWAAWMAEYARVTHVLTGVRGEHGYGVDEATSEASNGPTPSMPSDDADRG